MTSSRLFSALDRLDAALLRLDAAAGKVSAPDPRLAQLEQRNAALRAALSDAVGEIDAVLAGHGAKP